jgi:hypothetical protein
MPTFDYTMDPYAEQAMSIENRRRLAQELMANSMGQTVYSPAAGLAKAVGIALNRADLSRTDRDAQTLAKQRQTDRTTEMDNIFKAVQGGTDEAGNPTPPNRMQLAQLLAKSQDPNLSQAGLGMVLKGPGKVEWHDAGSMLVGTDESGNVVKQVPKGVTPDAKYGKETVGADKIFDASVVPESTKFTQGQENQRQRVGLSTVPASAVYAQGQENARQATSLGTVPAGTRFTQEQENERARLAQDNKPLTETQGNAAAFGMRAKVSNDIFAKLEASGAPVGGLENMLAQSRITNAAAPGWAQRPSRPR